MHRPGSLSQPSLLRERLLRCVDTPELLPVTLIIAPAGYGKSTLAAQWARATPLRVAGVPLGTDANSLPNFLNRLATALDGALDAGTHVPDSEITLDAITARLATIPAEPGLAIVLDDYHLIENRDVHQAMDALIAMLPPTAHLLLLSRTQPPHALGRLRAYGQLRELALTDLAFTREEVQAVIPPGLALRLTADQVDRLAMRTEGWIAGIRLALGALDGERPDGIDEAIDTLAHHPWLDEYLVEEVLDALPADVRDFLLRSAHLPWLEPGLCNHALAITDSGRLLRQIRRRLIFVRSGAESGTLAYHGLFVECVKRIAGSVLSPADHQSMHSRAAAWLEQAGYPEPALEHALAAEAWSDVARLARTLCRPLVDGDHQHSRLHWLRRLPEPLVLADPDLARGYISALQYAGHFREAQRTFVLAEPAWLASGEPVQMGYAASGRALFAAVEGDPELSLYHCYEALHHYPLDCAVERMHAWGVVAQHEFLRGNDTVANQAYRQAELCREQLPADQRWWTTQIEPDRSNRQALRGNLLTAEALCRALLDRLPAQYRSHAAKLRARLAAIYLEWNDLERAAAECAEVERDLAAFPHHIWYPEALMVVARVAAAQGETAGAEAMLRWLHEMCQTEGGRNFRIRVDSLQASIWQEAGKLGLVREWAATAQLQEIGGVWNYGDPDPRLMLARLALADGHTDRAHTQLRVLVAHAVEAKRWAELVPLAVWQVVACLALGDEPGALEALNLALRHGRRGGFVRSFLTPGHDLGPFLRRVRPHLPAAEAAWLDTVLDKTGMAAPPGPGQDLLSERERQVLYLLGDGHSNREIADRLFVSEHTVKKHVRAILAKLEAGNRTAVVTIARRQGLLS